MADGVSHPLGDCLHFFAVTFVYLEKAIKLFTDIHLQSLDI